MDYLTIMLQMKDNLESVTTASPYNDLVKVATTLIQHAKKLETLETERIAQLPTKEPAVMGLSSKQVTLALWRGGRWIHPVFEGHIRISRCSKDAQEISDWKIDGPPADDGWVYFINSCHYTEDYGMWISKEEADILRKSLLDGYTSYYGLGPWDSSG